jgi:DNA-binding FadR family transcriptional regulator
MSSTDRPRHALRQYILERSTSPDAAGTRLPTEREFARQFGLPRNAVRLTLAELEADGRLRREVGRGTFIAPARAAGEESALPGTSPAELMEARLRVEPAVVELVVVHATAADFARMHQCLQRAEAATTLAQFELWDAALHQAVAASTHNTLIGRIFDLFHEARQHAAFGKLRDRIVTESLRLDYQRQHRRIVAALEARDAPAAREAVLAHLTCARGNLFGL